MKWITTATRKPSLGELVICFWGPDSWTKATAPVDADNFGFAVYAAPTHWHNPDDDEDDYREPTHWMPISTLPESYP